MEIIEIIEYDTEVLTALQMLLPQLSPGAKRITEEALRTIIAAPQTHLFMIKNIRNQWIGTLSLGIYPTPTGVKAWIEDVAVDEQHRGAGHGRALVEHAIDFAKKLEADTLSLTSSPSRIAANELYRTLGFEIYETNFYKMRFKTS